MDLRRTRPGNGMLLGLFMTLAIPAAAAAPGRTPGLASVSPDGEATYSVPIALPPGTNGLTPVLSLDYRHRTRGGLLGVGWSVGGLSQIARCARTFAQDGIAEPAGKFALDRFCLDGQRLKVVNGSYGGVNSEYRTEIESFARIRSVGGSSTIGPAYFVVERADGRIYEYGTTAGSSIDGQSTPPAGAARTWALSRVRDRAGNVIDYEYTEGSGNTAFRIAGIRYNSNPSNGIGASHEVVFSYEQRPNAEVDSGYVAGLPVRQIVRLDSIEVRFNGGLLKSYELDYEAALSSGGRSRLSRITECAAGGTDCLAPTSFEWQDGSDGMSAVAAFSAQFPPATPVVAGGSWNLADVNGDGRNDYVFAGGADRSTATIRFRLSLENGAFGPAVDTGTPCPISIGVPFDANGDGRADFLSIAANGNWSIAFGSPTGLAAASDTGAERPAGVRDYRGADMNGDGLGDIAWSEVPDPSYNTLRVRVRFARSTGGFTEPVTLYSQLDALGHPEVLGGYFIGDPGRRVDLDGDGSEELLMNEDFTIARISDRAYATDRPDNLFRGGVPLDFNDDGCTDLAYKHLSSGTLRVRISACSISAPVSDLLGGSWTGNYEPLALDWNGDGRDDILLRGDTNWLVALSQGDAVAPIFDTGIRHEDARAVAGRDLDGDGLDDVALKTATQVRARFRAGPMPDLLASAADGFGVAARFTYRPLTDPDVHDAGAAAGWPEPNQQTNDTVVSELQVTDGSGSGGTLRTSFRYEGHRINVQGRGTLGFRKVARTEHAGSKTLTSVLTRRQDFPFTGLPEALVLQQPSGAAVATSEYRWSTLALGASAGLRHFPYASSVTSRRFAYGGSFDGIELARTTRNVHSIDATSGLVTDETSTTTEMGGGANAGSAATLRIRQSPVMNDVANWCLGRPTAVEITASHTIAGGAAVVRTADQAWSGPGCRPTRIQLFPGDSQLQVTYDLGYDGFGNVSSEKVTGSGMTPRTVTTQWGTRGQLPSRLTNPLGQASNYGWDEGRGLPTSFKDPNGLLSQWAYDAFGRPTRETLPDGTRTEWRREFCKAVCDARTKYRIRQDEVDSTGSVRASAWLELDRFERGFRLETTRAVGGRSVTTVDHDALGRVVRQYLPHWDGSQAPGHVALAYDGLGRLTAEQLVDAGGVVERSREVRYDGLAVTQTDRLGRVQSGMRTAWGPLAEVVDPAGGRTRFEHDAFSQLLGVSDALGNVVSSVTYDARGRKVEVNDMDRGAWRWTLNPLGEVAAIRDAKGQLVRFSFDALGRVTQSTSPDGTTTWTWGAAPSRKSVGRLAALSAPGYSESILYDAIGRPASHTITSDTAYRFDFTYNPLGLLDQTAYPATGVGGRFRVQHDYDNGQLTRIGSAYAGGETYWALNAQDASGNALDEALGSGVRVVSGFSPLTGNLEYRQAGKGSGGDIQDLAYGWDAAGNLAWRRDLNQSLLEEFRYDNLDRLIQSRRNGTATLDVDYDLIGNIRYKSDVCTATSACYSYHPTSRHAVVAAGGRNYAYDANGNMTGRDGASIGWNADNQPVSIAGAGGDSSIAYTPYGSRWRQIARVGSATESTIYAGSLFEKVTSGGVTTWRHYVTGPGGTFLQLRKSDGSSPANHVLAIDHLGSTDRIVDGAGNSIVAASFGAFGARRRPTWTGIPSAADLAKLAAVTRDGFTGHEMLDSVALIHMNGRVYDPVLGRFLSADPYVTRPFDGQALNRYAYVLNNPLTFADPSGFDPVPCLATQSGTCVQITVIGASWADYMRASGGAHSSEVASALERDPCGQSGSGSACSMPGFAQTLPSGIVLTVGRLPDSTLSTGGRLDAIQGFTARVANLAISSSPIALLFGADPDFQYFREPDSAHGRAGSLAGNVGFFAGGALGTIRGAVFASGGASSIARSFQGQGRYPGVDRFKDITLKKGTILYAGYPGQGVFYTTASAMRRAGNSSSVLFQGLQVAPHATKGSRARAAAFEVREDTPAAFALALANPAHGPGWLPQVVVPSYMTTLRYLNDFPLGL